MRLHIAMGITVRVMAAVLIATSAFAVFAMFNGFPAAEPVSQVADAQPLTVIATWTGTEADDFRAVLRQFTDSTGIHVNYIGTRAASQLLASDIRQGNPPALAILSSPGTLLQYQRLGYLQRLGSVLGKQRISAYSRQWQDIMTLGTSDVYTLPVKAEVHNLVWYDPHNWPHGRLPSESEPPTWSQLLALERSVITHGNTPWCVGLDSAPVSGWPAASWIADILLHQAGIKDYQRWVNGGLAWISDPVKSAWRAWGSLVTGRKQVYGGSTTALVTEWDKAGTQMFGLAPGCYLQHAPSFITLPYQQDASRPKPKDGYDFFPFPMTGLPDEKPESANGAWQVSADLLAMFHDTPHTAETERLVRYLAGEQAQQIWPHIPGGGATSANSHVPRSAYRDPVGKAVAGIVTDPHATLCFNAADDMPDTLQSAFYQGVMEYLQNPGQLHVILDRLDKVRGSAYAAFPGGKPDFSCGTTAKRPSQPKPGLTHAIVAGRARLRNGVSAT